MFRRHPELADLASRLCMVPFFGIHMFDIKMTWDDPMSLLAIDGNIKKHAPKLQCLAPLQKKLKSWTEARVGEL